MNMKRTALLIISVILLAACEKEVAEVPEIKELGNLEVSFAYKGETVRIVDFSPVSQTAEIEVRMNYDNVGWRVSSDSDWCIVEEDDKHTGSGTFTIAVKSNDAFLDRDEATVTLSAGDYKTSLLVSQSGNIFIIDKIYELHNRVSGSSTLAVSVPEGMEWTMDSPQWVRATKGEEVMENGGVTTTLTLEWDANEGTSRYGQIRFKKEDQQEYSAWFALYQFGNEHETASDGTVLVPAENASPIEIRVPDNTFNALECPEWLLTERVDNDDDTESWHLYFADNPSDVEAAREVALRLIADEEEESVGLPVIRQNYYPVGGLISSGGLALFAQRFNAGEDVSGWIKNGKVNVMGHIDMSGVEDWIPIGTAQRPFNLEFDGGLRNISGFVSSTPLFGFCENAVISNVIFDKTCTFSISEGFREDCSIAALASEISGTTVWDCESYASVVLNGSASADNLNVYAGGLVARVGNESLIENCIYGGKMSMPNTVKCTNGNLYAGGIAGYSSGTIRNCRADSEITSAAVIKNQHIGGVAGVSDASGKIIGCVNTGTVRNASDRNSDGTNDASRYIFLGGIVGRNEGDLTGLVNEGSIELDSNVKSLYAGGVAGQVDAGVISSLVSRGGKLTSLRQGRYICLGGLIGYVNMDLELDFTGVEASSCEMSLKPGEGNIRAGGLVGYVFENMQLSLKSPVWSGNVTYDISGEDTDDNVSVAGMVGHADAGAYLTVDDASVAGAISINANKGKKHDGTTSFAGVVATSVSGVTILNSVNDCEIKWTGECARSNGHPSIAGGIAGRVEGGVSAISGCRNNASIANLHYNNNGWNDRVTAEKTGGIIGYYGNSEDLDKATSNIKITDCHNSAETIAVRGFVGGIAGFLINAEVSECTYTGKCSPSGSNPLVGGIAGALQYSEVSDSKVMASLYSMSGGSCDSRAGGIAAFLLSESTIRDCFWNGKIQTGDNGEKEVYFAGIAAFSEAECTVSGCGVGGTILGTVLNESNFSQYLIGNAAIEATDCTFWAGE